MKRTSTWIAVLATALAAGACDTGAKGEAEAPAAVVQRKVEPTVERLLERSRERLQYMCRGEWIEVYDFVHPQTKEWMTIYQFLQGKDNHEYKDPGEPRVLAQEGDLTHLIVPVMWTPKHPLLKQADNVPEDWDPTELIEWIETWQFVEGDWYMHLPQQDPDGFFEQHPELRKKQAGESDEEVAKAQGQEEPK